MLEVIKFGVQSNSHFFCVMDHWMMGRSFTIFQLFLFCGSEDEVQEWVMQLTYISQSCCQDVTEGRPFIFLRQGRHFSPFARVIFFTTTTTTIMTTFTELFGEQLLQYNEPSGDTNELSTNELHGKTVVLYFSFVSDIFIGWNIVSLFLELIDVLIEILH